MNQEKVVLITGASSGIGYQTAEKLAKQGYRVFGAARRVDRMAGLTQLGVTPVHLDITDEDSIAEMVQSVIDQAGRIDVLVNNAGYGSYGVIENVKISEAKNQFEVNIFGLARLVQLVLPHMRAQHAGKIINISSMAGRITTYMGAWYHATKYALEAFSDALRMEVAPFGIDVVIIEPGGIKTNWGLIAADHLRDSSKVTVYEQMADQAADKMQKTYTSNRLSDPMVIANAIARATNSPHPHPRYLVGYGAKVSVFMHTVLPTRVFDKLIKVMV